MKFANLSLDIPEQFVTTSEEIMGSNNEKPCPICGTQQAAGNVYCEFCGYVFPQECCGDPAAVADYIGVRPAEITNEHLHTLKDRFIRLANELANRVEEYKEFRTEPFTGESFLNELEKRRKTMFDAVAAYRKGE